MIEILHDVICPSPRNDGSPVCKVLVGRGCMAGGSIGIYGLIEKARYQAGLGSTLDLRFGMRLV